MFLSPKGKILELEKGCTALDFAFLLHTQIGYSAVGASVNGKTVSLDTVLNTGDIVEIKVDKKKKYPNENSLKMVNSKSAKSKIYRGLAKSKKEKLL